MRGGSKCTGSMSRLVHGIADRLIFLLRPFCFCPSPLSPVLTPLRAPHHCAWPCANVQPPSCGCPIPPLNLTFQTPAAASPLDLPLCLRRLSSSEVSHPTRLPVIRPPRYQPTCAAASALTFALGLVQAWPLPLLPPGAQPPPSTPPSTA